MPRRLRTTVPVVLVAAVGLLSSACDADRRAISRDDLPDVPAEPQHVVGLDDGGFAVERLEVRTDELVEFRVSGDEDHGVRAELDGEVVIDTGLLFPGESTIVVFDEAGAYEVTDVADDDQVLTVTSRDADDQE